MKYLRRIEKDEHGLKCYWSDMTQTRIPLAAILNQGKVVSDFFRGSSPYNYMYLYHKQNGTTTSTKLYTGLCDDFNPNFFNGAGGLADAFKSIATPSTTTFRWYQRNGDVKGFSPQRLINNVVVVDNTDVLSHQQRTNNGSPLYTDFNLKNYTRTLMTGAQTLGTESAVKYFYENEAGERIEVDKAQFATLAQESEAE